MVYGTLLASRVKIGDYVIPPRNCGKHKEVVMIIPAGKAAVFVFSDASKASFMNNQKVCVGAPEGR